MRDIVMKNLDYSISSSHKNASDGYAIPDFLRLKEFEYFKILLNLDPVNNLLNKLTNNNFRFVSHNDIGVNRLVGWHKDRLNNEYRQYENLDLWNENSYDKFQIYKVLIYLDDHSNDNHGLKCKLGSHLDRDIDKTKNNVTQLYPKLGDVIIFDQRITHRGQEQKTDDNSNRILVSLGFGKNNSIYTNEFEIGTIRRQIDQYNL